MTTAIGIGVVLLSVAIVFPKRALPRINDITTDPKDPPGFTVAAQLPGNSGADMTYPAGFATQQQAAYPEVAPIGLDLAPRQAAELSSRVARELGWTVHSEDVMTGHIEATQSSAIFRFVDDIVIRIRPAASGSRIDVRSKSRLGKGDFGVNAARISQFVGAVRLAAGDASLELSSFGGADHDRQQSPRATRITGETGFCGECSAKTAQVEANAS